MDLAALIVGVLMQVIGLFGGHLPPDTPRFSDDAIYPENPPVVAGYQVNQNMDNADTEGVVNNTQNENGVTLDNTDPRDKIEEGIDKTQSALNKVKELENNASDNADEAVDKVSDLLSSKHQLDNNNQVEAQNEVNDDDLGELSKPPENDKVDPTGLMDELPQQPQQQISKKAKEAVEDVQGKANQVINSALGNLLP